MQNNRHGAEGFIQQAADYSAYDMTQAAESTGSSRSRPRPVNNIWISGNGCCFNFHFFTLFPCQQGFRRTLLTHYEVKAADWSQSCCSLLYPCLREVNPCQDSSHHRLRRVGAWGLPLGVWRQKWKKTLKDRIFTLLPEHLTRKKKRKKTGCTVNCLWKMGQEAAAFKNPP